jgi:hypothetical protein
MEAMHFPVGRLLRPPVDGRPMLTVVIDTEEEFDWSGRFDSQATATTNIALQPLAQEIFDRWGVVPTYVIDYPVAHAPEARAVLRPILDAGRCEIGAHLHPWVNPPHGGPVDNRHSYPGNLPRDQERQKLAVLTQEIEDGFGHRPTIYKAGRYGIGPATAEILEALQYRIDVSVVPHTSFRRLGGPDFNGYPDLPFETERGFVALPLSVEFVGVAAFGGQAVYPAISGKLGRRLRLPGILARAKLLERLRLSPEGHTLDDLIRQTRAAISRGQRFFMLTYHSSSLLPAATSYVRNEADRASFLSTLDQYFSFFIEECGGRPESISAAAAQLQSRP